MISVRHRWLSRDTGESKTKKDLTGSWYRSQLNQRISGIQDPWDLFIYPTKRFHIILSFHTQVCTVENRRKKVLNEEWRQHERERGKQLDEYVE